MRITAALIDKLIALRDGAQVPDSALRGEWFRQMQDEGILLPVVHGSRKSWKVRNSQDFVKYIQDRHDISSLEKCLVIITNEDGTRAEQVSATGDSKFVQQRTFKGFLINCYDPIEAQLGGKEILLAPAEGSFTFISDYEAFELPVDVVIVGIENAENFRHILRQRDFFERYIGKKVPILFVSRYPQGQSKDLRNWLMRIPNRYVHFGDLDRSGINIFLTEFNQHLGARSSFLIPEDYEERIQKGSKQRYSDQYDKFGKLSVTDQRLQSVIDCIHQYRRGYDQEGFIE